MSAGGTMTSSESPPPPAAKPVRSGKPAGRVVTADRLPTEKELGDTLRDACRHIGWRCAHFRAARTAHGWRTAVSGDGQGFPDWVLVHPYGGILFVELKAAGGRLEPAQKDWGEALIRAGGIHRVVQGKTELDRFVQELADRAARR